MPPAEISESTGLKDYQIDDITEIRRQPVYIYPSNTPDLSVEAILQLSILGAYVLILAVLAIIYTLKLFRELRQARRSTPNEDDEPSRHVKSRDGTLDGLDSASAHTGIGSGCHAPEDGDLGQHQTLPRSLDKENGDDKPPSKFKIILWRIISARRIKPPIKGLKLAPLLTVLSLSLMIGSISFLASVLLDPAPCTAIRYHALLALFSWALANLNNGIKGFVLYREYFERSDVTSLVWKRTKVTMWIAYWVGSFMIGMGAGIVYASNITRDWLLDACVIYYWDFTFKLMLACRAFTMIISILFYFIPNVCGRIYDANLRLSTRIKVLLQSISAVVAASIFTLRILEIPPEWWVFMAVSGDFVAVTLAVKDVKEDKPDISARRKPSPSHVSSSARAAIHMASMSDISSPLPSSSSGKRGKPSLRIDTTAPPVPQLPDPTTLAVRWDSIDRVTVQQDASDMSSQELLTPESAQAMVMTPRISYADPRQVSCSGLKGMAPVKGENALLDRLSAPALEPGNYSPRGDISPTYSVATILVPEPAKDRPVIPSASPPTIERQWQSLPRAENHPPRPEIVPARGERTASAL